MGVFWPKYRKINPTFLVRVGRLAHWLAVLIAAFWASAAIYLLCADDSRHMVFDAAWTMVPALAFFLGGRGARYVIAGE